MEHRILDPECLIAVRYGEKIDKLECSNTISMHLGELEEAVLPTITSSN